MPLIRSEAFVLGRIPFKESSWLVTLFTRSDGVLRAVARGGRRPKSPFLGVLEPFNHVEAELSVREGKGLWTLRRADLRTGSLDLFGEWGRASLLYAVLELLERGLPEHNPEERTFRLVLSLLRGVRAGVPPAVAWTYFLLWFLRIHGMLAGPERCSSCGASLGPGGPVPRYAPGLDGWVCTPCAGGEVRSERLLPQARTLLALFLRNALPDLAGTPAEAAALNNLKNVVYLAVTAFLGRPLNGAAALEGLFQDTGGGGSEIAT